MEAGGENIGHAVAKDLGYQYVDRRTVFSELKEAGENWKKLARDYDERYPSIWERYDWSFRGFIALNQSVILNYALQDNVVLIGRGGNFLLRGVHHALRIPVNAPEKERIQQVIAKEDIFHQDLTCSYKRIDEDTARWMIRKVDAEMEKAVHFIYGKGINDPSEYDEVFDLGTRKMDEVIPAIEETLQEKQKLNTGEARDALRMRAIAAKVKAGIATNPALAIPTLEVEPKGKALVLLGLVRSTDQYSLIEEVARKLAGDIPLECSLHYRATTWGV